MIDLHKTYSGGLTIQDLRNAWVLLEPTPHTTRTPHYVTATLAGDWRRTEGAVKQILGTLRRMHRGGSPSPGEKGSLWQMPEAERRYVFTGLDGETEAPEPAPEPAPAPFVTADALPLVAALRDVEAALRELIEMWK